MRINEVYEHEPLLPYQEQTGCDKVGTHSVDITLPLTVTPTAAAGTVTTSCQGTPRVTCTTADDGLSCTLTIVQRVCVNVPVRFGVTTEPRETTIACSGRGTNTDETDEDDNCVCLM